MIFQENIHPSIVFSVKLVFSSRKALKIIGSDTKKKQGSDDGEKMELKNGLKGEKIIS